MSDWVKDSKQQGLYKRPRSTGDVWAIKSRIKGGGPVSLTIGKCSLFSIQEARKETRRILQLLAMGIHPTEERKKQQRVDMARNLTLEYAINQYADIASWKDKTRHDNLSTLQRRFGDWCQRPLASITKEDIQARFIKIKHDVSSLKKRRDKQRLAKGLPIKEYSNEVGLGEAQRAFRYLSAIFNSFIDDDAGDQKLLPKGNPCSVLKNKKLRKALKPRDRYLNEAERMALYDLLSLVSHKDYPGNIKQTDADLVWLIIHTGLRLDEARTIEWRAVNFEKEIFTVYDTKNHRDHTLPMTNATKDMFKRRAKLRTKDTHNYVFPSPSIKNQPLSASRTFRRIPEELGFDFTAHDLRRTVATVASDLGYDLNAIGQILNHSKRGVTAGYIQSTHKRLKTMLENIQNSLFAQSYDA